MYALESLPPLSYDDPMGLLDEIKWRGTGSVGGSRRGVYRLSAKVVKRSAGRSATAAAAYRAGDRIEDRQLGEVYDYSKKSGIVYTEIFTREDVPEWAQDREALWNAAELAERRGDAQTAREYQIALPADCTHEERVAMARELAEHLAEKGMVVDLAVHEPKEGENHHAHLLCSMRELGPEGFAETKNRDWNTKEFLQDLRRDWAAIQNRHLELAGLKERVDHRTLDIQREEAFKKEDWELYAELNHPPMPKIGPHLMNHARGGDEWATEAIQSKLSQVRDQYHPKMDEPEPDPVKVFLQEKRANLTGRLAQVNEYDGYMPWQCDRLSAEANTIAQEVQELYNKAIRDHATLLFQDNAGRDYTKDQAVVEAKAIVDEWEDFIPLKHVYKAAVSVRDDMEAAASEIGRYGEVMPKLEPLKSWDREPWTRDFEPRDPATMERTTDQGRSDSSYADLSYLDDMTHDQSRSPDDGRGFSR